MGFARRLGEIILGWLTFIGQVTVVAGRSLAALPKASGYEIIRTMARFGWGSLGLGLIVAAGTGAVIVLETATYTVNLGARDILGGMAGISIMREFGPLMVALVMAGWVGASNAAELANLSLGGQIGSLRGLGVDPYEIIVAPRVVGTTLAMAALMAVADVAAIVGGGVAAWVTLGIPLGTFFRSFGQWLHVRDIGEGMVKTLGFAQAIALISCRAGLSTQGGSQAVGVSVAGSVVQAVVAVLIIDCFVTAVIGGSLR
jgi:phospholipid/cholesterol/gamma-HCH transport system permease protein